jgi:hypothetical protein
MSHLSILPTLLRDVDLLAEALTDLGQVVHHGGAVEGFAGERVPVLLRLELDGRLLAAQATSPAPSTANAPALSKRQAKRSARGMAQGINPSFSLGWARQLDGSLALVGDLGRIAAANPLQELLSELSRRYALRQALQDASGRAFAGAQMSVETQGKSPSQAPLGAGEGHALGAPLAQPIRRS